MRKITSIVALTLTLAVSLSFAVERPLTPTERILRNHHRQSVTLDVQEASANDVIENLLERSNLQYTFIRSEEDRLISLKTEADVTMALETVVFAAGFNIHRDGNYWVIHPLPAE